MTNRNCFADGARLAQFVEHETLNLRAMGSSLISGSNEILYVSTLYGKKIFLVYADRKCSPLLKLFPTNASIIYLCSIGLFIRGV